jgi:hypothetical protein
MTSTRWRKSRYSGGNPQSSCVELSNTLEEIRDSKNPAGPTLHVDVPGLVRAVKAGQFDHFMR